MSIRIKLQPCGPNIRIKLQSVLPRLQRETYYCNKNYNRFCRDCFWEVISKHTLRDHKISQQHVNPCMQWIQKCLAISDKPLPSLYMGGLTCPKELNHLVHTVQTVDVIVEL